MWKKGPYTDKMLGTPSGIKTKFLTNTPWDIVAVFLNWIIDYEIYIKQPQGFEDGLAKVCRLKKAIYGLPQSARTFYFQLDEKLSQMGFYCLETN